MKKFLKVFSIVILVLAVIGVTCFFFFKRVKKLNNTTDSFAVYLSENNFNAKLEDIHKILSKQVADENKPVDNRLADYRLDLIINTSEKLDNIVFNLSTYKVQSNTQINNAEIAKSLKQVKSSRVLLNSMINEYQLKLNSAYFDRCLGANDLYIQACTYLTQYANLANLLNANISDVNKNADIQFNVYNVYANVVISTFSKTNAQEKETEYVVVDDASNINLLNGKVVFENKQLKISNKYSNAVNKFGGLYATCNKNEFAKNLSSNVTIVNSAEQDTVEKQATYYFKSIFGI